MFFDFHNTPSPREQGVLKCPIDAEHVGPQRVYSMSMTRSVRLVSGDVTPVWALDFLKVLA